MERSEMSSTTYTSLSHGTERCLKTKTTNLHRTPPLIMHIVAGCARPPSPFLFSKFVRCPSYCLDSKQLQIVCCCFCFLGANEVVSIISITLSVTIGLLARSLI